ncbi:uncharacterized protein BJ171DRAFT_499910 [Polychytrium aggregatum]|uniref:uncharacterized protein n=1 Tax=Polychytrium aggregatum TaxID=110093 RepID=UPI0022FF381E|nr:uncharacterized protein BJ171DRAFT_499910 [Polychytrium aggregatum]KAI9205853.1 hypothetical protein BJ171DRAFT_499910 [Polychytrium aggregatum]
MDLPTEILVLIFQKCPLPGLYIASRACRKWRSCSRSRLLRLTAHITRKGILPDDRTGRHVLPLKALSAFSGQLSRLIAPWGDMDQHALDGLWRWCGASLQDLDLSTSHRISNLPAMPLLRSLNISRCFGFSPEWIGRIPELFPNLQRLDLSGTHTSDKSLAMMAGAPAVYAFLSLSHCLNITDQGLRVLIKSATFSVAHLDISFSSVSFEAFCEGEGEQLDPRLCRIVARGSDWTGRQCTALGSKGIRVDADWKLWDDSEEGVRIWLQAICS